jgi:hypothetical protein
MISEQCLSNLRFAYFPYRIHTPVLNVSSIANAPCVPEACWILQLPPAALMDVQRKAVALWTTCLVVITSTLHFS